MLDGELVKNQKFELIFFKCDQPPETGFSPVGATKRTQVTVNLIGTDDNASLPFDQGDWCWGVFAGHKDDQGNWVRDAFVSGQNRSFTYNRPGGGTTPGSNPPGLGDE
jgi:hypothetical protein